MSKDKKQIAAGQPLAEVFGFPIWNDDETALRYRENKLCPFQNKTPNCTKDKADAPLGVCSVFHQEAPVICCPVRFRQNWKIISDIVSSLYPKRRNWTTLSEVKLLDAEGCSAGVIDYVLVFFDEDKKITDFASIEVQAVYITGNLRNPFTAYTNQPGPDFEWKKGYNYPKPDYLSSTRKRLVPQMLYKGGIFNACKKRQIIVAQRSLFETLPKLPESNKETADVYWFLYDLELNALGNYELSLAHTAQTEFQEAIAAISVPKAGSLADFERQLQQRLDKKLDEHSPDAPDLQELIKRYNAQD